MYVSSSISIGSGFWSVNHTSIHENSESKDFRSMNFLCEISNNWPNDLLRTNVNRMLNLVNNRF